MDIDSYTSNSHGLEASYSIEINALKKQIWFD